MNLVLLNLIFFTPFILARCPSGAFEGLDTNSCYRFFGTPDNFFDAETQCNSFNGHLVSINNGFVNAFITKTAKEIMTDSSLNVWLGGNKVGSNWSWTDGSQFNYANWEKGQPGDGQCLVIQPSTGQWLSADCNANFPYFCEVPSTSDSGITCPTCTSPVLTCSTSSSQKVLACDSEWTYFNSTNSCYKVIFNQNWQNGENLCQKSGAHLTSIHNFVEHEFLLNFAKADASLDINHQVWIGLSELNGDGVFTWTDGTPFDYQYWGPGDPFLLNTQRCVLLLTDMLSESSRNLHWITNDCNIVERAAVCKKPAKI